MTPTARHIALFALLMAPVTASAQDEPAEQNQARQILAEAQAHEDAGRFALAAQRYQDLHATMSAGGLPRAPIALWSAGGALAQVPGRERAAIALLRRFLSDSTPLTDDEQVRDWRSSAVTLIAELEARAPEDVAGDAAVVAEPEPDEPVEVEVSADTSTPSATGGMRMSPIGPIVIGVGGAAVIVGGILGGLALAEDGAITEMCPGLRDCSPSLRDQYEGMRTMAGVADALLFAGVGVAAIGVILTLTIFEEDGGEQASVSCHPMGCVARGEF